MLLGIVAIGDKDLAKVRTRLYRMRSGISINSNIASLNAQRGLDQSSSQIAQSFSRLASGLRINKASDDAAGLAISESLRVDTRIYQQGMRNLNDGLSLINITEGAVQELKNILIRGRELTTQASNDTLSDHQRSALDEELQALGEEYNRIVETTAFNGISGFSNDNSPLVLQGGYGSNESLAVNFSSAEQRDIQNVCVDSSGNQTTVDALLDPPEISSDGRYVTFFFI